MCVESHQLPPVQFFALGPFFVRIENSVGTASLSAILLRRADSLAPVLELTSIISSSQAWLEAYPNWQLARFGRRRRGLLAGCLNALSGLFDEFGYDLGFEHVDGMATACFDYSCLSTIIYTFHVLQPLTIQ